MPVAGAAPLMSRSVVIHAESSPDEEGMSRPFDQQQHLAQSVRGTSAFGERSG
jgi:hypothetical protein